MNDLISIIIPIYNTNKKLLNKCLKSVLDQTYQNLEILLIDDGSNQKCVRDYTNLTKNDNRVKIIRKENSGVSEARNVGIKNSNGKYIMFVDSDDYIDDDYVMILYSELKKEAVNIAISGATIVDENFKNIKKMMYDSPKTVLNICEYIDVIINYPYFTCVKMLFDKTLAKEGFNSNLKYGEDLLFTFNMIKENEIVYIKNCGYYYVQNKNSVTYSFDNKSLEKYIEDNIFLFSRILEVFPDKIKIIENRLFTKLNICLSRYIQSDKINYSKFIIFMNESKKKMILKNIELKKINYVSRLQKIQLFLLKYKFYRLYFIFIKSIYRIKRVVK